MESSIFNIAEINDIFEIVKKLSTPDEAMKNQGENKTETILRLESHEFVYYVADLIGPFHVFKFLLSNKYMM